MMISAPEKHTITMIFEMGLAVRPSSVARLNQQQSSIWTESAFH